jgi:hypothetical protein
MREINRWRGVASEWPDINDLYEPKKTILGGEYLNL